MQLTSLTGTMNASSLFKTVCQTLVSIAPKMSLIEPCTRVANRNMHYMCNKQYSHNLSNVCANKTSCALLQPLIPMYNITCGLKVKTILKRRCRDCLLLWKNDRKYIICKTSPKHNQTERKKQPYKTWILTSASQSRVREW